MIPAAAGLGSPGPVGRAERLSIGVLLSPRPDSLPRVARRRAWPCGMRPGGKEGTGLRDHPSPRPRHPVDWWVTAAKCATGELVRREPPGDPATRRRGKMRPGLRV